MGERVTVPGSGGVCLSSCELAWSLVCDRTPSSELFSGVDMVPCLDVRSSSRLLWLKPVQHTQFTPVQLNPEQEA